MNGVKNCTSLYGTSAGPGDADSYSTGCLDGFRWKLNGTIISPKPSSHYSLSGGNLRISRLNKDQDSGTYQCLASNSYGTIVSREASLTFAYHSSSPGGKAAEDKYSVSIVLSFVAAICFVIVVRV
ncbi:hypothetical protein NFI96_010045 [Prochilodus magdalenae]|nr:hypothetical protein NFI96_010045 [Prochilodus magdalenae]